MAWTCPHCQTVEEALPLAFGAAPPWALLGVTEDQLEGRVRLTPDLCVVDEKHFFVRGRVHLPIVGREDFLTWTVWASVSLESLQDMLARWDRADRAQAMPYFGWIYTQLPGYPNTLEMRGHLHPGPPGADFQVELEPSDHPLSMDQRLGLPFARVEALVHALLHKGPDA